MQGSSEFFLVCCSFIFRTSKQDRGKGKGGGGTSHPLLREQSRGCPAVGVRAGGRQKDDAHGVHVLDAMAERARVATVHAWTKKKKEG